MEILSNIYKQKRDELTSLKYMSLEQKVERTKSIISIALNNHQRPIVAWSGGKDSTVLLYFVLKQMPDIDVVWVNTGVEYPECVNFIMRLTNEWGIKLHIARPEITFWQVIEKYGYPFFGKGNSRGYWFNRVNLWKRKGKKELARIIEISKASTECCRILKEKPADKVYKALGVDCIILGNIVEESHQRFLIWAKKGDYFYSSSEKRWKAWPLSIWTEQDIWKAHQIYNIPHSEIYDKGHRRNGCWPCLMDIKFPDNHLRSLRETHPKLWHFLIWEKGIGEVILALKLGLRKEEIEQNKEFLRKRVAFYIEQRPCFFDKL